MVEELPHIQELYDRAFGKKLDHYLTHGWMDADDYATCTDAQKVVIQTLKRSISRITKRT
jgi:hypothetical protein